jgi:hypothetical protein
MWIGEHLSRCDGYLGLAGFDSSDRNPRQAYVAHSVEQAMECCLVGDKIEMIWCRRARSDLAVGQSGSRPSPDRIVERDPDYWTCHVRPYEP